MAKNQSDITISHADVTFGGTTLGYIEGGVEISMDQTTADAYADDFGESPVLISDVGSNIEVTLNLAQYQVDKLALVMPEATVNGNALDVGGIVGQNTRTLGAELVITPIDSTRPIITIFTAQRVGEVNIPFRNDEQTLIAVTFRAVIDETEQALARFGTIV